MNRNDTLKSSKAKKSPIFNPSTTPATLNLVSFTFRVVGENTAIQSRCVDWAPFELESRKIEKE